LPPSATKVELIDGEVVVSPSPSPRHQEVLRRLLREVEAWASARSRPSTVLFAPADIRFRDGRILQPDLAIWLDAIALPEEGPIDVVPDVCAEVLSRDRLYDRVTKRAIYAQSGVREYWAVERAGPVERWSGDGLDVADELYERLESTCLDGLDIDLSRVFWR